MMNVLKYGLVTVVLVAVTYTGTHIRKSRQPVPRTMSQPVPQAIGQPSSINTSLPDSLVNFAETLLGTPYNYGCSSPDQGFDCSGFVGYVFEHFNLKVPRSSVDFSNVGKEVSEQEARRGDLILFTGTNAGIRTVGHIGLVTSNTD